MWYIHCVCNRDEYEWIHVSSLLDGLLNVCQHCFYGKSKMSAWYCHHPCSKAEIAEALIMSGLKCCWICGIAGRSTPVLVLKER